mmetsp:Transcript_21756/g.26243  ORF Transcript_21756/g.26243 Transcript_21756/m.26243 type:complete len:95 (-) Transcript_21756:897-1181(-)
MSEVSGGLSPSGDDKPNNIKENPKGTPYVQNRRRNRNNRPSRHVNPRASRFQGKCEQLKGVVYDVTNIGTNTDLFTTTTKAIAEYIATEYDDAG